MSDPSDSFEPTDRPDPADMAEDFDPAELAAANALDEAIDELLAGHVGAGVDPVLTVLHAAVRTDPPRAIADRLRDERDRRLHRHWQPTRVALAALAYLFLSHGFGNFFVSSWVADNLGQADSPHAVAEGSFALIAVGLAVVAGVIWRRATPLAVGAGVPLALVFGIMGITEIDEFTAGGALHLTQGLVGVTVLLMFSRYRRYSQGRLDEEEA